MSKKWIITICVGVLVCLSGIFWLLTNQIKKQEVEANIITAIPLDAIFIIQFDKLMLLEDNFNNSSAAWNSFIPGNPPLLHWLKKNIATIGHNDAAALISHSKTSLSIHPLGKNELAILCSIALPSSIHENNWENFLNNIHQPLSRTQYQENVIISMQLDEGMLYFSCINNIALISSSLIMLQSSIRHIKSGESLLQNEQFVTVAKTAGSHVDVSIFLNHRQLPYLCVALGNKIPSDVATFLSQTANWTVLDGEITSNLLQINGFVFPSFTEGNYLSTFLPQSNNNIEAWDILPSSTNFMMSFSFSDAKRFLDDYVHFLDIQKELNSYKQKTAALDQNWQQNAATFFCSLYPAEICLANFPLNNNENWITLLKTNNVKFALEQFRAQSLHLNKNFVSTQEYSGSSTITIYNNPAKGLFEALFGSLFSSHRGDYFTVVGDWFYFSDNHLLLKQLSMEQEQSSLKKYLSQIEASQYTTNNACLTIVAKFSGNTQNVLLPYLYPNTQGAITKTSELFPLNAQILQLRPSADKLYVNFISLFESAVENRTRPQPQPQDAATATPEITKQIEQSSVQQQIVSISPANSKGMSVEVINHYTKEKELFVQLPDYTIGLQSKDRKWLWKKEFNEPLLDTVIQIDYLRNGKLQLLFTTPTRIYLYDRNGNTVSPYPVNWNTPVYTGISVFDYDKDLNYRIFTTHNDHTVRAYNKRIQPIEGWKPFKSPYALTRAPEFFRVASRDYIVLCNEQTMYILDRKGNERVKLEKPVVIKPGTPITAQHQPPLLKVTTIDGKQALIYLKDGKVEVK